MFNWFWRKVAEFCARERVFAWIVERSLATPYYHLKRSPTQLYMARYWLFNPYRDNDTKRRRWPLPISVRVHFIAAPDEGPEHDHPWAARSIILRGWYVEERDHVAYLRGTGTTSTLKFGEFHKITQVSPRGCWTLFIMYQKRGGWGFKPQ